MATAPSISTHRRSDDPEAIAASLTEAGGVIIEDFLDPAVVDKVNAELDPVIAADNHAERIFVNDMIASFFGEHVSHVTAMANHSNTFVDEVLLHPLYHEMASRVLGPNCADWSLNVGHLLQRGPGAQQQYIHRDQDVWNFMPKPHPELELSSMVALVDFTAENGATRVVPGSHRWEDGRYPSDDELVVAEMPAGAALLYLGSTFHAGGTNSTADQQRRGFHLSFVLGWLRTEENNTLATPPDIARHLPQRAQELIGYAAHDAIESAGGYLGTVDIAHPYDLMAKGRL
jgi:ectoine hydroxylase-related dioxygenase (phytanoyl-CoA dioxygenase family)